MLCMIIRCPLLLIKLKMMKKIPYTYKEFLHLINLINKQTIPNKLKKSRKNPK